MNRIKKQKCGYHEDNRDISEYCFWHTDIRKSKHVDVWECKKCKDHLDKALYRQERIYLHNKKQEDEAYQRHRVKNEKRKAKINKSMTEDLWECIVKNELCKGLKLRGHQKYLYKESIPKDVLRLKRASMKLDLLIIKRKGQYKDKIKKLKIPLLQCKKHGDLFLLDVIKSGKSSWTSHQKYKCRQCMSELHRNYYIKRKDYVLKKHAEYREKNPEKRKQIKLKSKEKCNGKNSNHDAIERSGFTGV